MKQYRFEICTLDGEILDRGWYRAESEDDLAKNYIPVVLQNFHKTIDQVIVSVEEVRRKPFFNWGKLWYLVLGLKWF